MAYDIGPKIGIDGEAEFRSAIQNINANIKAMGSEMKVVTEAFADNADSMEALTAKTDVLERTYEKQAEHLGEVTKMLERATEKYGENATKTVQWQRVVNESRAALQKTANEIAATKTAMENLEIETDDAKKAEEEFRKELKSIQDNIRTLGSELKYVTAEFDDSADSIETLASKSEVLRRTYAEQEKYLAQVEKMLIGVKDSYEKNSEEVNKWERAVYDAKTELKKTEKEMKKTEQAMDDLSRETDDAEEAFENLGDAAEKSSGKFDKFEVAAGNLISSGIGGLVDAIGEVAATIYDLDDATEEYRVAQGKLQTAFEVSGYSVDTAKTAYTELYKILGDTDTATEAAQLMAKLSMSEKDMAKWTDIAAGVMGTFGDALPIEGLIEASNETAKTGSLTGQLADALNWAGIAEDDFQKKLDACSNESERNQLIMETLTGAYDEATDAFYKNNEEVVRSRENQAKLDEITGKLGESVSEVKNAFIEEFGPALGEAAEVAAEFISGLDEETMPYLGGVKDFVEGMFGAVAGIWSGDFEAAGEGIGQALSGIVDTVEQAARDIWNSGLLTSLRELTFDYDISGTSAADAQKAMQYAQEVSQGIANYQDKIQQEKLDVYLDGQRVGSAIRNAGKASGAPMY